jgi:hypothetical protein
MRLILGTLVLFSQCRHSFSLQGGPFVLHFFLTQFLPLIDDFSLPQGTPIALSLSLSLSLSPLQIFNKLAPAY